MLKSIMLIAAPLTIALAVPAAAQDVTPMTPAEYVKVAGASDLFERQSAQIVLATTTDANVRSFATMMLSAHAQSTQMVKAAALKSGVRVAPPMLMPVQMEMIAQLKAESGPARDAAYIAQQRGAHNQALSVQMAYASDGTAPTLRMAAGKIVPVVQEHIAMLMKM
jgi:putative membrane protein